MRLGRVVLNLVVVLAILVSGIAMGADEKVIKMSVAGFVKKGTPDIEGLFHLQQILEERSKGKIKVEVFYGGTVGGEAETIGQVRSGSLQLSIGAWATVDAYARLYCPWVAPYLIPSQAALQKSWDGKIGKAMRDEFEKNNLLWMGIYFRGNRQLTSNRKVVTPADLAGMKLRLPETAAWIEVWKELGCLPTPIPSPEVFSALQMGVVEAQENPITSCYEKRLWEVQKYLILTNHIVDWNGYFVCKSWYEKLSVSNRRLIKEAIEDALDFSTKMAADMEAANLKDFQAKGIQVLTPDLKAFREKAKPAMERLKVNWAPWVYDQVLKDTRGQ